LLEVVREEQVKAGAEKEEMAAVDNILQAERILKTGNPLEFLLEGFRCNHAGHEENARGIVYAFCAQSSATSKGIQPEITGEKGSGKSHSASSAIFLFPQEYVWESSFSPKYLLHRPPKQGSIIYIDERLSDDLMNLVKRIMSNFQRETRYGTIIDKKPMDLIIPKRQVIMGSTVGGVGDNQYNDRTVQLGILNTASDDLKYYEFEAQRRSEGRPEFVLNDHIRICREILSHIRQREFVVTTPKIQFAYIHDKRLMNILYDFVEASCILNYCQRVYTESNSVVHVTPNQYDLSAALNFEMFRMADQGVEGRLTKAETALHQKIQESIKDNVITKEMTESEIADLYGKSQQAIRKLLYGDGGKPDHIMGGLVDKTPAWYTVTQLDRDRIVNGIRIKKVDGGFKEVYAKYDP
jgi:hypothetical protein